MAAAFVDKARIAVKAGKGGNGAVAFHREKYIAAGGPDGGDGGRGGDVIVQVDEHMSTLMDFRYKRKYVAGDGGDGQGARRSGKDGQSLVIRVPKGTLLRDAETNEIIHDMSDAEPFVLCRGGRGGWGNCHFATPTRQAPRFAKAGMPGEEHDVVLELKLLADVSGSEGRDPAADFGAINEELRQYSPALAQRPQIVVANKSDIMADEELLEQLRRRAEEEGYPLFAISAAAHQGTRELVQTIAARLQTLPPVQTYEAEYVKRAPVIDTSVLPDIRVEDGVWIVEGPWLERLIANVNFSDYESRMFFDKQLRESGLFQRMEEMGVQDGDLVRMYNLEFEYQR